MTNINIIIPEELHRELKIQSVLQERPLKEIITEHLEEFIRREDS